MDATVLLNRIFEQKEIRVLLGLAEPLLCELTIEGRSYTCYVLQHRMIHTKSQKKVLVQEVLWVETEPTLFELLLNKQLTIYEYFEKIPKYRIGKIANKVFEAESIKYMELIENRFPKPNLYIDLTQK